MPTIELLPRRNKKTETLSYSLKDEPTFSVEMGLGEREYMYSEPTKVHEEALKRFENLKLLPGQKKRLTIEFRDGRKFVIAREIR